MKAGDLVVWNWWSDTEGDGQSVGVIKRVWESYLTSGLFFYEVQFGDGSIVHDLLEKELELL